MGDPQRLESRATNAIMDAMLNRARLGESMQQLRATHDAICSSQGTSRLPGGDMVPTQRFISLRAAIEAERVARATFWQFVSKCASRRNRAAGWHWRKKDSFGTMLAESPLFDMFQECFAHAQEHGFKSGFGPANFTTE
jgi:hypothetical protein